MIEMRIDDAGSGNDRSRTILFTGDLGRYGVPLNPDPDPPPGADFLVLESTYGDRSHCADDLYFQLEKVVKETNERGGIVLIPSFAVGRSQQTIYVLNVLMETGRLPKMPIHLDSPMAVDATKIYRSFAAEHEAQGELRARNVHLHRSVADSKRLNDLVGPAILISSSGMLTGGRILHHLKRLLPDPRNTVVLVGYQAAGTRGRALQEGAATIRIHGQDIPAKARVEDLCGFSGHADADETMKWLARAPRAPERTFLVHGEPRASEALAGRIREEKGWKAHVPKLDETIRIDRSSS